MATIDWNPHLYLKFDRERTQPAIDLISRIRLTEPGRIADVGCGPGNSTLALARRWPDSDLIGIDNSPAMIAKAGNDFPFINWQLLDAGVDELPGNCDVVFSNAAIQWIPDHPALLRKFRNMLCSGGVLAVQVPRFFDMPLGRVISALAAREPWAAKMAAVSRLFTIHGASEYYEMLSPLFATVELWETDYVHVMESHHVILEMVRSTGLKPYLDSLDSNTDTAAFEQLVFTEMKDHYPTAINGKVLFPFKRLFFIAAA
jgi:trans-aconitate 2-methyltransferase